MGVYVVKWGVSQHALVSYDPTLLKLSSTYIKPWDVLRARN